MNTILSSSRRFAALLPMLGLLNGTAADWSQFRGPQAGGVDSAKPLPTEWNVATGKNVRWQTPVPGLGHACPILWGNRVYVTTAVGAGEAELILLCQLES